MYFNSLLHLYLNWYNYKYCQLFQLHMGRQLVIRLKQWVCIYKPSGLVVEVLYN